jgi:hypothetical protein
VFGINCNNKWIGNSLTGLTLSILSLVVFQITFPISLKDELKILILKISSSVTFASKIVSFLIIKYYSSKIFRVYDQIEEYQIKSFIKYDNYFSTIISILFVFTSTGLTTAIYFCDFYFNNLFKELTEKQELIPIDQKLQIFLINFYVHALKTLLQLMYREFNTRYISIIETFIEEIDRRFNKPDRNVIINAQRTVLQLIEFRSNFKKYVEFIQYFIVIDILSMSGIIIYALIYIPTYNMKFNIFCILYLILMLFHFSWTIKTGLKVNKLSEELSSKLNRWNELSIDGLCSIEMKVLERTIQLFKENDNIQAEDSL